MPRKKAPEKEILQYGTPHINVRTKDPQLLKQYAEYMEAMLVTPGWAILEAVLRENIVILGDQIISKCDSGGNPLQDADVDLLRIQHAQIKQLLDKPRQLINSYSKKKTVSTLPEYDVYRAVPEGVVRASSLTDTT